MILILSIIVVVLTLIIIILLALYIISGNIKLIINSDYVSIKYIKSKDNIIDTCYCLNSILYLLNNGKIIKVNLNSFYKQLIKNNIELTKIIFFNNKLYGIGKNKRLYTLPKDQFDKNFWLWNLIKHLPGNIKSIVPSYDLKYLWIQTDTTAFLYKSYDSQRISKD